jgi:hypothetical protein
MELLANIMISWSLPLCLGLLPTFFLLCCLFLTYILSWLKFYNHIILFYGLPFLQFRLCFWGFRSEQIFLEFDIWTRCWIKEGRVEKLRNVSINVCLSFSQFSAGGWIIYSHEGTLFLNKNFLKVHIVIDRLSFLYCTHIILINILYINKSYIIEKIRMSYDIFFIFFTVNIKRYKSNNKKFRS